MDTPQHLTLFKQIAERSLDSWQRKLKTRNESYLRQLLPQQELLYQAVYKGFSFPDLWGKSADVALAAFPLIERFALSQQWLPLLEAILARCPEPDLYRQCQLLNRIGQFCGAMQTFEAQKKALALHQESLSLAQQIDAPFLMAKVYYRLAVDHFEGRHIEDAKEYAEQSLHLFQVIGAAKHHLAPVYDLLGQVCCQSGNFAMADQFLTEALKLFQEEGERTEAARVMVSLGLRYYQTQRYDEAISYFNQAQSLSNHQLDAIRCQLNIGASLFELRQFKQAEKAFHEIDQAYLQKIGQLPLLAMRSQNVGNALMRQEKGIEAALYLREAIALWKQCQDQPRLGNAIGMMGQCLFKQGQVEEAVATLRKAVQLLSAFPKHPDAKIWLKEYVAELENVMATG